ncbi:MAG: PIN domain-containing protein [Deltaproteobacteria bacterium]|nr:PIN domain-containing protein [Deltaproteobacteria bacterium]
MPALFVDTSAFYALADADDRNHERARTVFERRAEAGEACTSDYVFVETWSLIRARMGRGAALRFWDAMRTSVARVLGVSSDDLRRARAIVAAWPDQDFSLIDATSFALMERHGIDEALALDAHFRVFRAGPGRRRPFRVVP